MDDMSKAFDSINRTTLLSDLSKTIQEDKLNLIKVLLNVELSVKCGNHTSKYFITDTVTVRGQMNSCIILPKHSKTTIVITNMTTQNFTNLP